jgi:hypothetical protein
LDRGRDGFGGSGESVGVGVHQPDVDSVHGAELGDSRAHLAAAHHSHALRLRHRYLVATADFVSSQRQSNEGQKRFWPLESLLNNIDEKIAYWIFFIFI